MMVGKLMKGCDNVARVNGLREGVKGGSEGRVEGGVG